MEASHTKLKSCQSFHGPSRAPPECRPYLQSHFELRAIVVSPSSNDHPYTCPLCMRPQILKAGTANTAIPIIHHLRRPLPMCSFCRTSTVELASFDGGSSTRHTRTMNTREICSCRCLGDSSYSAGLFLHCGASCRPGYVTMTIVQTTHVRTPENPVMPSILCMSIDAHACEKPFESSAASPAKSHQELTFRRPREQFGPSRKTTHRLLEARCFYFRFVVRLADLRKANLPYRTETASHLNRKHHAFLQRLSTLLQSLHWWTVRTLMRRV